MDLWLGAFRDFGDLVGHQAVHLSVRLWRGLLTRRDYQAEHVAGAFIKPVLLVMYLVLPVDLQVFLWASIMA